MEWRKAHRPEPDANMFVARSAVEANINIEMTFHQQVLLTVSRVGLDVVDTSKCMVEEADGKVKVFKPAELTLYLVDSTTQWVIPNVMVKIKSLVDGSVISVIISPSYGGTFCAMYTPHNHGL